MQTKCSRIFKPYGFLRRTAASAIENCRKNVLASKHFCSDYNVCRQNAHAFLSLAAYCAVPSRLPVKYHCGQILC